MTGGEIDIGVGVRRASRVWNMSGGEDLQMALFSWQVLACVCALAWLPWMEVEIYDLWL